MAAALLALKAITTRNVLAQSSKPTIERAADKLAWDEFLKQAIPIAQRLIGSSEFSFDEYLYRIGSLATRLKEIPDSKPGPYTDVDRRVWLGPSFRGTPFFIIQWRMARVHFFHRTIIRTLVCVRSHSKGKCCCGTSRS